MVARLFQGQMPAPAPSRTTDTTGAPAVGPQEGRLNQMMSDPRAQAFFLQMAASLLGQRGIAEAAGQGLGAIGRFDSANYQMEKANEQEERRRFESDRDFQLRQQAAARAGRGGGGSAATAMKEFNAARNGYVETLLDENENLDEPRTFEEIQGLATLLAMRDFGDTDAYNEFLAMDDPAARTNFATTFAGGPQAGNSFLASRRDQLSNPGGAGVVGDGAVSALAPAPIPAPNVSAAPVPRGPSPAGPVPSAPVTPASPTATPESPQGITDMAEALWQEEWNFWKQEDDWMKLLGQRNLRPEPKIEDFR